MTGPLSGIDLRELAAIQKQNEEKYHGISK